MLNPILNFDLHTFSIFFFMLASIIISYWIYRRFSSFTNQRKFIMIGILLLVLSFFSELLYSLSSMSILKIMSLLTLLCSIFFLILFLEVISRDTQFFSLSGVLGFGVGSGLILLPNFFIFNPSGELPLFFVLLFLLMTLIVLYLASSHLKNQLQLAEYYQKPTKFKYEIFQKVNSLLLMIYVVFMLTFQLVLVFTSAHLLITLLVVYSSFPIIAQIEPFFINSVTQHYYIIGALKNQELHQFVTFQSYEDTHFVGLFLSQIGNLFQELTQTETELETIFSEHTTVLFHKIEDSLYLFLICEKPRKSAKAMLKSLAKKYQSMMSISEFENEINQITHL
jgi:hypothetical protein